MKTNTALGLMLFCMGLMGNTGVASQATEASTTASTTPAPPTISYSCHSNGSIIIRTKGISGAGYKCYAVGPSLVSVNYQNISSIQTNDPNTKDCIVPLLNTTSLENVTLSTCNLSVPVYLYLSKMGTNNKTVLGGEGFQEYRLSCGLPIEGKDVSVNITISGVTDPTPLLDITRPLTLGMEINPPTAPIGEKLTVTIKETGSSYFLLPKECVASDGQDTYGEKITLLEGGKPKDKEVLGNFDVSTAGQARATMYAFRFLRTSQVVLTCTVNVCQDKTCVDAYKTRKRRSSSQDIKSEDTFEVSAGYKIVDKETIDSKSSQANVRFDPAVIVSLLTFVCVLWRKD